MEQLGFKPSRPLTLGIELEWQILNPETGHLCNKSTRLLDAITKQDMPLADYFKPEGMRSMIEINTRIHDTPDTLLAELYEFQAQVKKPLQELNLALTGGGTHPFATWTQSKGFSKNKIHD